MCFLTATMFVLAALQLHKIFKVCGGGRAGRGEGGLITFRSESSVTTT